MSVTRTQLVRELAERSESDRKSAAEFLAHFEQIVKENVAKGENVVLSGFVKFSRRATPARPARKGINPFTGEPTTFKAKPASKAPRVTALAGFKEVVASGKVPKAPAKKAAAKKAASKKAAAKKRVVKKTAAKKTAAKKTATKKRAVKKTAAKKATRRR